MVAPVPRPRKTPPLDVLMQFREVEKSLRDTLITVYHDLDLTTDNEALEYVADHLRSFDTVRVSGRLPEEVLIVAGYFGFLEEGLKRMEKNITRQLSEHIGPGTQGLPDPEVVFDFFTDERPKPPREMVLKVPEKLLTKPEALAEEAYRREFIIPTPTAQKEEETGTPRPEFIVPTKTVNPDKEDSSDFIAWGEKFLSNLTEALGKIPTNTIKAFDSNDHDLILELPGKTLDALNTVASSKHFRKALKYTALASIPSIGFIVLVGGVLIAVTSPAVVALAASSATAVTGAVRAAAPRVYDMALRLRVAYDHEFIVRFFIDYCKTYILPELQPEYTYTWLAYMFADTLDRYRAKK